MSTFAPAIVTRPAPVFDWDDEGNCSFDTGEKEIRFEGCDCCSETRVISHMNISEIARSIRSMREIIAAVMEASGITEEEIARG